MTATWSGVHRYLRCLIEWSGITDSAGREPRALDVLWATPDAARQSIADRIAGRSPGDVAGEDLEAGWITEDLDEAFAHADVDPAELPWRTGPAN